MPKGGPPALTAAQQYVLLKASSACQGAGILRAGRLEWRYAASPTPLSRSYDIRMTFSQGTSPATFVDAPDLLLLAGGRPLPHVYSEDPVRLCLFRPGRLDWNHSMQLDRTVVPWTALWLFFFEDWLSSGEWKGGGVHVSAAAETEFVGHAPVA